MVKQRHGSVWASVSVATGLGTVAMAGCLQLGDEHCARQGGDIACGDRKCVMSLEEEVEAADGCVDEVPARGGFVHVKYGLPSDFDTFQRNLETAVGRRSPPLMCNEEEYIELRPRFEVLHAEVIEPLDGRSRARRDSIDLGKIDDFTRAVDLWIEESCEAQPGDAEAESGSESGMPPADTGGTTGPMICPECPATAPFCDETTLECMGCDAMPDPNGACTALEPTTPLCVEGACVACTPAICDANDRQVCDGETHSCVPCTAHSQCEVGACELAEGRCFPADATVIVVDKEGGPGVDALSVAEAISGLDEELAVIRVRAAFGPMGADDPYDAVVIGGGRTIALLSDSDEPPRIMGSVTDAVLRVEGAGTAVYVDELILSGHTGGIGLRVAPDALAWLDRTQVVLNLEGGIVAEADSTLVLRNSVVGSNGFGVGEQRGLDVQGATVHVLYTTLANNDASTTDSIRCMGGTVTVRNSIVVGREGSSIECAGIDISRSALDEHIGLDEDGNENVGPWSPAWFVSASDFHLTDVGMDVFADIAVWRDGDPSEDLDGQARPDVAGAADYAGADRIP